MDPIRGTIIASDLDSVVQRHKLLRPFIRRFCYRHSLAPVIQHLAQPRRSFSQLFIVRLPGMSSLDDLIALHLFLLGLPFSLLKPLLHPGPLFVKHTLELLA